MDEREHQRWTDNQDVSDEELLKKWRGLVTYMAGVAARTYKLTNDDAQDLSQSLLLRLFAMPHDKRPFEWYTRSLLNNAIRDAIRDTTRRGATPYANWREHYANTVDYVTAAPPNRDQDADEEGSLDRLTPNDNPEDSWLVSMLVRDALPTLDPREREAFLAAMEGVPMREVGCRWGKSGSNASQHLQSARRKLAKAVGVSPHSRKIAPYECEE